MDDWLLSSMADNDNLEWIDVLTGDVLAGDGSVQRSQPRTGPCSCQIHCIVACAQFECAVRV